MRPIPTASPSAISLNTRSSAPRVDFMSRTRLTTSLPISSMTLARDQVSERGFRACPRRPQWRERSAGYCLSIAVRHGSILAAPPSALHLEQPVQIKNIDGTRGDALHKAFGLQARKRARSRFRCGAEIVRDIETVDREFQP